jgi:hypothetical protein
MDLASSFPSFLFSFCLEELLSNIVSNIVPPERKHIGPQVDLEIGFQMEKGEELLNLD